MDPLRHGNRAVVDPGCAAGGLHVDCADGYSLAARKKPLHVWKAADLHLPSLPRPRGELLDLYVPKHETVCEVINGKTPEEAATRLADRLHEEGLL